MTTPDYTSEIPYGYCHCGCGKKTKLAKHTRKREKTIAGQPMRYIAKHSSNKIHSSKKWAAFWDKVEITADDNQCWYWKASCYTSGYGQFNRNGKLDGAHRIAWMYPDYVIPDGLFICHSCDNKLCCNPKHLFLGTQQDNVDDCKNKNRNYKPKGELQMFHKLTDKQVIEIRNRYKRGVIKQSELASEFNVAPNTISFVVNRKTWKHLP